MENLPKITESYAIKKVVLTIGEAAQVLEDHFVGVRVSPSAIRYWEKQFAPWFKPVRKSGRKREPREGDFKWNERRYRKAQIDKMIKILTLIHEEGYTLYGAKRHLILNHNGRIPKFDNFKMMHYTK